MSVGGHALAGVLAMSPWEAVEVAGVREVTVGLVGDCWGANFPVGSGASVVVCRAEVVVTVGTEVQTEYGRTSMRERW